MSTNLKLFLGPVVAVGLALSGCGGGSGSNSTPVISVGLSPSAAQAIDQGQSIKFTATVTNDSSSQGVTWAESGPGALSGQTSTSATYTAPTSGAAAPATVTATSVADTTKSASVNVAVTAVPAITTMSLQSATIGVAYSQSIGVTGGAGALTYSISTGSLPAGLTLNSSTGAITGTPSGSGGTAKFTVKVTDSSTAGAMSAIQNLSVTVNGGLAITTNSLANGSVNVAYSAALQNTGGVAPFTWSLASGALPAGLGLNSSSGAITGTPTATGTSTFKVQVMDSSTPAQTATQSLSLTIEQLSITTNTLLNPMVGESYNQTLQYTETDATLPVTWSLATGSTLPAGLSLNGSTGAITGTPTTAGTTTFTVQLSDSSTPPQTASQSLSLTVTTATQCGSGSESLLSGQYAMSLLGFDGSGPAGMLGSFTADGTGNITAGVEDINSNAGIQTNVSVTPTGSSYNIGSDHRGCLTLVAGAATRVFRFSVGGISSGVATSGRIIEFDSTGSNMTGTIEIQDSAYFSNGAISGNTFSLRAKSPLSSGGFYAAVGLLSLSGTSVSGSIDINNNGTVNLGQSPTSPLTFTGGTYNIGSNGRGTLSFTPSGGSPINLIVYVMDLSQVNLMSSDPQSANTVFSGSAGQQFQGPPYTNSSLNAASVLFASGQTASGGPSLVEAGVFTPDGNGNFTFSGDQNGGGTASSQTLSGTYSVDSSGRVQVMNAGSSTPELIFYLTSSNGAGVMSTDTHVLTGDVELQVGGPFTNSSLTGTFPFATIDPVVAASPLIEGVETFGGNGNVTGTFDLNAGGSLSLANAFTATYAVSSIGRVVMPANGTTQKVTYIINAKVVTFDYTSADTNPTLIIGLQ
jgi:large repetitive protein